MWQSPTISINTLITNENLKRMVSCALNLAPHLSLNPMMRGQGSSDLDQGKRKRHCFPYRGWCWGVGLGWCQRSWTRKELLSGDEIAQKKSKAKMFVEDVAVIFGLRMGEDLCSSPSSRFPFYAIQLLSLVTCLVLLSCWWVNLLLWKRKFLFTTIYWSGSSWK